MATPSIFGGVALAPAVLAALLAAAVAGETPPGVQLVVLVGAVSVGLPHGGLDHLAGRQVFQPQFGRWWPAPFLASYAGLAVATLLLWWLAPGPSLGAFLLLSVLHFGAEDAQAHGSVGLFSALAHGGVIVVAPAVLHPAETTRLFEWLTGGAGDEVRRLTGALGAAVWLGAVLKLAIEAPSSRRTALVEITAVAAIFALASPLIGFALYFALIHSPRAFNAQVRTLSIKPHLSNVLRALPLAGLALLLGVLLWRRFAVTAPAPAPALVKATFITLSALTVPHMWLDWRCAELANRPAQTG